MAMRIQFSRHGGPQVLAYTAYVPATPGLMRCGCTTRRPA
jgi:hypothetical protein